MELSFRNAKVTFPLKTSENISLSAFPNFIVFGKIADDFYISNSYFKIYFEEYIDIFDHFKKLDLFFANGKETKPPTIINAKNGFNYELNFETLEVTLFVENDKALDGFIMILDVYFFVRIMKAFCSAIIPSLCLTFEQSLFCHFLLKKDIDIEKLNTNPQSLFSLITLFINTYDLKYEKHFVVVEIYDFYIEILILLKKFSILIANLT